MRIPLPVVISGWHHSSRSMGYVLTHLLTYMCVHYEELYYKYRWVPFAAYSTYAYIINLLQHSSVLCAQICLIQSTAYCLSHISYLYLDWKETNWLATFYSEHTSAHFASVSFRKYHCMSFILSNKECTIIGTAEW
jgi:hypothetical protein